MHVYELVSKEIRICPIHYLQHCNKFIPLVTKAYKQSMHIMLYAVNKSHFVSVIMVGEN